MTAKVLNLILPIRRHAALVFVGLVVIVVILLSVGFYTQIKNQLNDWKLLPQPERLTELYFTTPNSLASTYVPGQVQKVNFTVHNLEYQTETYRYQIIEENQDGSKTQTLTSSTFTLSQNQYQSVSFTGPLVDMGANARIVINLPTVHESIDYLLTRSKS
jgi:uncharacterized membrane protein